MRFELSRLAFLAGLLFLTIALRIYPLHQRLTHATTEEAIETSKAFYNKYINKTGAASSLAYEHGSGLVRSRIHIILDQNGFKLGENYEEFISHALERVDGMPLTDSGWRQVPKQDLLDLAVQAFSSIAWCYVVVAEFENADDNSNNVIDKYEFLSSIDNLMWWAPKGFFTVDIDATYNGHKGDTFDLQTYEAMWQDAKVASIGDILKHLE